MYSEEIKELLTELNLQADPNNPDNTRGDIIALIASLHPDKTGGVFADEAQKEKLDRALKLRDLFDREMSASMQMVPIQHVTSMIEAITKAQALAQVKEQPAQQQAQEQFRRGLKRKYALPKITSALIAALCFTLFSFLGNFKNSPFYRLAVNIFANADKVSIINEINREGGRIKMNEAYALFWGERSRLTYNDRYFADSTDIALKMRQMGLINSEDWPDVIHFHDKGLTRSWLERNTAISDIDLYSSDEDELFKPLEKMNTQLEKSVSEGVRAITSEIDKRIAKRRTESTSGRRSPQPNTAPQSATTFNLSEVDERELGNFYLVLAPILREARAANRSISDLREWLPKAKKRVLDTAERRILITLMIGTILACCAFVVTWLRERSDQRWVEFVSSDEGLELMFSRLCDEEEIASRTPPKFQLSEFTRVLAKKDVPRHLSLILGKHLDGKELSQVASSLIARLKEQKVITQVKAPTIKPWFEITAVDFTDAANNQ